MEFRVLGTLEVVDADGTLPLGSAHQRLVLALLLRAPEPVSLDLLIDELWSERPPASAQHAVRVYVSGIRKLLRAGGEVAVRTSPSGYAIDVAPERIDARRLERLLSAAQRALTDDPSHAERLFEEALALWRGPPLARFEASELARREADRLAEFHTLAVEGVVEAKLLCGDHREVIGQITALVAANPLRERPRRLLMLALYRSGRHADALAAYRDACAALDEIGLQPGPELRQLEEAILRHDASLRAQSPADAAGEIVSSAAGGSAPDRPTVAPGGPAVAFDAAERVEASAPAERRKVVTALSCGVTSSTALGEELDPEALGGVVNRSFGELRSVIERHGGMVDKFIGDAVMR